MGTSALYSGRITGGPHDDDVVQIDEFSVHGVDIAIAVDVIQAVYLVKQAISVGIVVVVVNTLDVREGTPFLYQGDARPTLQTRPANTFLTRLLSVFSAKAGIHIHGRQVFKAVVP
ncbi:hypothetical protein ACFL1X_11950 [Candidatus Hydrogenedentota bacterium]